MYSLDTKAILLLNTRTALDKSSEIDPLKPSQWNDLVGRIVKSSLKTPAALFDLDAQEVSRELELPQEKADWLKELLSHIHKLEIELKRLQSADVWILTRADADYPRLYKQRLKGKAPVVLFGAGEKLLLNQSGVAVVGSRNVDEGGKSFTEQIGSIAANNGWIVFSGGARGVDIISMQNALEGRGCTVGVIPTSLLQTIKKPIYRKALSRGDLALISPFGANTRFSVGAAMGRNKLIYTLAQYAVVVASDLGKGGTWAGSIETIKNNWLPVFVRQTRPEIAGNAGIIQKGGIQLDDPFPVPPGELKVWMEARRQEWLARLKEETFEQKQLF